MQSLSHWDSEKVFLFKSFCLRLLSYPFFILYPTIFHTKNFPRQISFKKNKHFLWFNVVNTSLPQKIPATPHKLKKKFLQKAWKKDIMATNLI